MLAEAQAAAPTGVEVVPVEGGHAGHVALLQQPHCAMVEAAHLVYVRVIEPDVARGDAERGGRAVEHDGLEPINLKATVAPLAVAHQELRQISILAATARVLCWIRKVPCKNICM